MPSTHLRSQGLAITPFRVIRYDTEPEQKHECTLSEIILQCLYLWLYYSSLPPSMDLYRLLLQLLTSTEHHDRYRIAESLAIDQTLSLFQLELDLMVPMVRESLVTQPERSDIHLLSQDPHRSFSTTVLPESR